VVPDQAELFLLNLMLITSSVYGVQYFFIVLQPERVPDSGEFIYSIALRGWLTMSL
jgi:hypothetical protein